MRADRDALTEGFQAALAEGLLPAGASLAKIQRQSGARPWPVVVLIALGAWFSAAILLLGGVFLLALLGGDWLNWPVLFLVLGAGFSALGIAGLRLKQIRVFVEQMLFSGLLIGQLLLVWGLFDLFTPAVAGAVMLLVLASFALAVSRAWLRVLLGVGAALFAGQSLGYGVFKEFDPVAVFGVISWVLVIWLFLYFIQNRLLFQGRAFELGEAIESFATGWGVVLGGGLVWISGPTFLVAGMPGGQLSGLMPGQDVFSWLSGMSVLSVLLSLIAAIRVGQYWQSLRSLQGAGMAILLAGLAWFQPALGFLFLMLALLATTGRFWQATGVLLAIVWAIGSFYYQLAWPLVTKALGLMGMALLLGGIVLSLGRDDPRQERQRIPDPTPPDGAGALVLKRRGLWVQRALILTCCALTFGIAGFAIWEKENLIAQGAPLLVKLAPVDPRSLIQGDYMALRFELPPLPAVHDIRNRRQDSFYLLGVRDAEGVAHFSGLYEPGTALQDNQFKMKLSLKDGEWMLATDAWFFKEGEAERFARARYGEFRILPDGRALLVGMRDINRRPVSADGQTGNP